MNRRDDGSVSSAPRSAAGAVIVMLWSAALVASCQTAAPSRSNPTSTNSVGSVSPSPAVVATASIDASASSGSGAAPAIASAAPLTGDAAAAAETADTYLHELASGRYQEAWNVLAASARQAWGNEQSFAKERGAFYTSAGTSMVVSAPDDTAATLAEWVPSSFDGDRQRAYVVNVNHPQIQSNASREVLIVAPDSSGEWHIWIGR